MLPLGPLASRAMSDLEANKRLFLEMVDRVVGNDDWASASQYFTDDFVAHGAGPKPTSLEGLQRLTKAWRSCAFPTGTTRSSTSLPKATSSSAACAPPARISGDCSTSRRPASAANGA